MEIAFLREKIFLTKLPIISKDWRKVLTTQLCFKSFKILAGWGWELLVKDGNCRRIWCCVVKYGAKWCYLKIIKYFNQRVILVSQFSSVSTFQSCKSQMWIIYEKIPNTFTRIFFLHIIAYTFTQNIIYNTKCL